MITIEGRDLAYYLAQNAVDTEYRNLPEATVEITKKFIMDTLACAIAGSAAPGCKEVLDCLRETGGRGDTAVWVHGDRLPAPDAALMNGIMAHAQDFDDTHDTAVLHCNVSVMPAAIAMAERKGRVTGRELITAVALGVDLMCRLGLGVTGQLTWILSSVAGYFGAALAAGKILGLNGTRLHDALGIVFSQCAGSSQCLVDGALVKRMQPGLAARAGVFSALLAEKGVTGAKNVFEGQYGFFPLYYPDRHPDRDVILRDLGTTFEGTNLSIKLYPSCRYTHAAIDGTMEIIREHDVKAEDVKSVTVHATKAAYDFVGRPFQVRENPQVDAQFSIPYTVAVALLRRKVLIEDFTEATVRGDEKVHDLAKRVGVVVDQAPLGKGLTPGVVEIATTKGEIFASRVEILKGEPRKPVSMEEVTEKLWNCTRFSAYRLPLENLERMIGMVRNLEKVDDISEVTDLLKPS